MGGNRYHLPRKPKNAYLDIEKDVKSYLNEQWEGLYRIPRFYESKADFGDMDVLLAKPKDWAVKKVQILDSLGISQHHTVGHVLSTVYQDLQVDFFAIPESYLDSTYHFMSFNDLGNLIGRIARRFNLKYGEKGLTYVHRYENGNQKAEIEVSRDFKEIYNFLGLDYTAWITGFSSLEEMFEWVIASPYFSVAPYLDGLSETLKRRMERTTVKRFVAYLVDHEIRKRYDFPDRYSYISEVNRAFPKAELKNKIDLEKGKERRTQEISTKWNGTKISQMLPHLEGKALGQFIIQFKASFPDFESFVLETSATDLDQQILEFASKL